MNVLHLVSWYPNEKDPYNGDFIQRHLLALAGYIPVTVIFLVKDSELNKNEILVSRNKKTTNLEEWIVRYGSINTGVRIVDQYFSIIRYKKYFKRFIDDYIREKGQPDLIHVHVALNAGLIALDLNKELKIPYVVTEHSTVYHRNANENLWNRLFIYKKFTRKIIRNAAAIMPVSDNLGKVISKITDFKKLFVISNVVDTSIFYFNNSNSNDKFIFIHVSGMSEQKNMEGLLKGMKLLSLKNNNWIFKMVGPASDEQKKIADQLGISNYIEWIGEVSYDMVAALMKKSHVHILFSRYENQPCVNLEALCCGLPVIATDVGGLPEVVDHSNGALIPSQNENALADAMEKMILYYNKYDRKKISDNAISRFGYNIIGKQILKVYETVISEK